MTAGRYSKCVRGVLHCAALAALLTALPGHAQAYPAKPVRLVVPFGVGGSVDTLSRLVAQRITETWGQQILVDVRPGAGSLIGTDLVAKSKPDGYTLLMANASSTMAISVYRTVPYDLLRDFTAVGMVGYTPHLVVVHLLEPGFQVNADVLERTIQAQRNGGGRLAVFRPGDVRAAT